MSARHTPGPWEVKEPLGRHCSWLITARKQNPDDEGWPFWFLAEVGNSFPLRKKHLANARLIAAAPKLLAALRTLAEAMTTLRVHVRFTEEQDAALDDACALVVELEVGQ